MRRTVRGPGQPSNPTVMQPPHSGTKTVAHIYTSVFFYFFYFFFYTSVCFPLLCNVRELCLLHICELVVLSAAFIRKDSDKAPNTVRVGGSRWKGLLATGGPEDLVLGKIVIVNSKQKYYQHWKSHLQVQHTFSKNCRRGGALLAA